MPCMVKLGDSSFIKNSFLKKLFSKFSRIYLSLDKLVNGKYFLENLVYFSGKYFF
jgi:hypothetical protein